MSVCMFLPMGAYYTHRPETLYFHLAIHFGELSFTVHTYILQLFYWPPRISLYGVSVYLTGP
jgi:hypothetical protein